MWDRRTDDPALRRVIVAIAGNVADAEDGDLTFRYKSARIYAKLVDGAAVPMLRLVAVTNFAVPRSNALYKWIAEWGMKRQFGSLSVYHNPDGTDNVNLIWTVIPPGGMPDPATGRTTADVENAQVSAAISFFAMYADGVDDEVQVLFGGRREVDPPPSVR